MTVVMKRAPMVPVHMVSTHEVSERISCSVNERIYLNGLRPRSNWTNCFIELGGLVDASALQFPSKMLELGFAVLLFSSGGVKFHKIGVYMAEPAVDTLLLLLLKFLRQHVEIKLEENPVFPFMQGCSFTPPFLATNSATMDRASVVKLTSIVQLTPSEKGLPTLSELVGSCVCFTCL